MSTIKKITISLIITSLLPTFIRAADDGSSNDSDKALYATHSDYRTMHSRNTISSQVVTNLSADLAKSARVKFNGYAHIAKSLAQLKLGELAAEGMQELLSYIGEQSFTRYLVNDLGHPQGEEEFNVDSICIMVGSLRRAIYSHLNRTFQKLMCKEKSHYAYNSRTDERYEIYEDKSLWRAICQTVIPNAVPLRNIFIHLTDNGVVQTYVNQKLDRLIVTYLLKMVHDRTDKTLRGNIEEQIDKIIQTLAGNAKDKVNKVTQDLFSPTSVMDRSGKEKENEEEIETLHANEEVLSPLWEYLSPRINHWVRQSVQQGLTKAVNLTIDELTEQSLYNLPKLGPIRSALNLIPYALAASSSVAAGSFGAYFLGLDPYYTTNTLLMLSTYVSINKLANWLMATGTESVGKTVGDIMKSRSAFLSEHYLNSLIPLSKSEHLLFGLNEAPCDTELALFGDDYAKRKELRSQTLAAAAIHEAIRLASKNESLAWVIKLIGKAASSASEVWQRFYELCLNNKNANLDDIVAASKLEEPAYNEKTSRGKKLVAELKVAAIFSKLESGQELLDSEREILGVLEEYPSYAIKLLHLKQEGLAADRYVQSIPFLDRLLDLKPASKGQDTLETFVKLLDENREKYFAEKNLINRVLFDGVLGNLIKAYDRLGLVDEDFAENNGDSVLKILHSQLENALIQHPGMDVDLLASICENFEELLRLLDESVKEHVTLKQAVRQLDCVKDIIEPYVALRNAEYIAVNLTDIKALQSSALTEGMELADIIDLHKRMNRQDRQRLIAPLASLKIAEVRKPELEMIKEKYQALKVETQARHLTRAFLEEFNWGIFVKYAREQAKNEKVEYGDLKDYLAKTRKFDSFCSQLTEITHSKYQDLRRELYQAINHHLSWLSDNAQRGSLEMKDHPKVVEKSWIPSLSWSSKEDVAASPQENVNMAVAEEALQGSFETEPAQSLKVYKDTDITGYRLIQEITGYLEKTSIFEIDSMNLQQDDFVALWEHIHAAKKKHLYDLDKLLLLTDRPATLAQILDFKNAHVGFANRLFYGYEEVMELMCQEYREEIKRIKQQPLGSF